VKIVGVCWRYESQPYSLHADDIFSQITSTSSDVFFQITSPDVFFQITSTSSDRSTVLQVVPSHLFFRRHRQPPTLHGLADVYHLPNGYTSSCLPLASIFDSTWPRDRNLHLTYLPQFFLVTMKMGHAYIGRVCLERHFRSTHPEVATRIVHGLVEGCSLSIYYSLHDSTSHLRASANHELVEDTSIRIHYSSCDSTPSRLPRMSAFVNLQKAPYVDLYHARSNPLLSPASFGLHNLAAELSPNPKSRMTCRGIAVHAILFFFHISIAVHASLMCAVRLFRQFPSRFVELVKIVGVCWESHLLGLRCWESYLSGLCQNGILRFNLSNPRRKEYCQLQSEIDLSSLLGLST
jgi:hypothetical protein